MKTELVGWSRIHYHTAQRNNLKPRLRYALPKLQVRF